ncbi:hypothetical protein LV779_25465 [Streptomyces thinghirensis]|nr:hypothetical protein [Streptomyces thinghirensis]
MKTRFTSFRRARIGISLCALLTTALTVPAAAQASPAAPRRRAPPWQPPPRSPPASAPWRSAPPRPPWTPRAPSPAEPSGSGPRPPTRRPAGSGSRVRARG